MNTVNNEEQEYQNHFFEDNKDDFFNLETDSQQQLQNNNFFFGLAQSQQNMNNNQHGLNLSENNFFGQLQYQLQLTKNEEFNQQMQQNNNQDDSAKEAKSTTDESLQESESNMNKKNSLFKKAISKKKNYQPIIDSNIIYKYEENPDEYKKARKRLQNRESATRVRQRKKNYSEFLENDLQSMRQTNSELLLQNARLQAENNLLKQQISFYEKLFLQKGGNISEVKEIAQQQIINMGNKATINVNNNNVQEITYQNSSLHELDISSINPPMRISMSNEKNTPFFYLAILTVIFCLFHYGPFYEQERNIKNDALIMAVQAYEKQVSVDNSQGLNEKNIDYLLKTHDKYENLKILIYIIIIIIYVLIVGRYCFNKYVKNIFQQKIKDS